MTLRGLRLVLVTLAVLSIVGGGRPAAAQNVTVTAATPTSGAQDTPGLVVKITGKNFAPGASSQFLVSGTTDSGGVAVRGTTFVSATEVDATVDIAGTATIASFDIKVTNTSGRSGKGSDLFSVIRKTVALPPLTVTVANADGSGTPYALQSDGAAYAGYQMFNGSQDGAFINGAGGLGLALISGARSMRFTLGTAVIPPSVPPPSYCVPTGTWVVHQIDRFAFNVMDARNNALGIQSMGSNGVPLVVTSGGTTTGYEIGAIVNFVPDGADPRAAVFTLRFGGALGTTLSRTGAHTWLLEHDATDPILLQCTASAKGKQTTYDVGYFQVPFSLTAACNLSGASCQ